jgi:hypothetical protein
MAHKLLSVSGHRDGVTVQTTDPLLFNEMKQVLVERIPFLKVEPKQLHVDMWGDVCCFDLEVDEKARRKSKTQDNHPFVLLSALRWLCECGWKPLNATLGEYFTEYCFVKELAPEKS